jgi:hypothetical protein
MLLFLALPAAAQPILTCGALFPKGNVLRSSGITELVSDYLITCSGGVPTPTGQTIPSYTVTATLNANVTSRLVNGSLSEALLTIDEPWPPAAQSVPSGSPKPPASPFQILCMPQGALGGVCAETGTGGNPNPYLTQPNIFVGMVTGPNQVSWTYVPIDAPGAGTRTIRLTNVRANVSTLPLVPGILSTPVTMTVSISGTPSVTLSGASQTVARAINDFLGYGFASPGLPRCTSHNASLLGGTGSPAFDFRIAFQARDVQLGRRNIGLTLDGTTAPEVYAQNEEFILYNQENDTETGFYFPALFTPAPGIGLADFGTRLQLTFNNVVPGTHIFVPVSNPMGGDNDSPLQPPSPVPQGIDYDELLLVQADQYGNSLEPGSIPIAPTASIAGNAIVPGAGVAEVNYIGNTGYAVYEVMNTTSNDINSAIIPIAVAFNSSPSGMPPPGQTTVSLSYAPAGGPWASSPIADATSRIPRFSGSSVLLTNYSVNVCTTGEDLDFSDTGRSGVLLYDPSSGAAYAGISNGGGTYSYAPDVFTPGFDILRTGDFNADGKADLILYNSHTAVAYIGFGNGDGTFNFQSLFWSPGYDTVETGDINGDGKTDVALYNSTTGTLYTGISNGDGTFAYLYHLVSPGFTFVRLSDFTGDGKADVFLYNSTTGAAFLGVGDGTGNFTFNPLNVSAGYALADIGDLNGDGKADVILYNPTNGNAATGISDGMGGFSFTPLLFSPGFSSVRLADYMGPGDAGVTVYNKTTGAAYFGTGNGAGGFSFQSLFWGPGYDMVVPEDVNGDGKTDIILYNSVTGTAYTGISNGSGGFAYTYSLWGPGKVLAR